MSQVNRQKFLDLLPELASMAGHANEEEMIDRAQAQMSVTRLTRLEKTIISNIWDYTNGYGDE